MSLYSRLDHSQQQFRLLRLVTRKPRRIWELKTFSIHDDISWVAVSYCWGNTAAIKSIHLIGGDDINIDFHVRPSLHAFFKQMASENRREWFFVDAVCINQTNVVERNFQVSSMGEIYRRATEVIAWIYPQEGDEEWAKKATEFGKSIKIIQKIVPGGFEDDSDGELFDVDPTDLLERMIESTKQFVLHNDYWSRLWVVQEVLLARHVTIRCFNLSFSWSEIMEQRPVRRGVNLSQLGIVRTQWKRIARSVNDKRPTDRGLGNIENAFACTQLWQWSINAGPQLRTGALLDFCQAVENFALQERSQVHDSIFGLVGIAKSYIKPSYTMSIAELYAAALYNCLLSMWSKGREEPRAKQSPGLFKIDLSPSRLQSTGDVLMYTFNLEPFDDVIFIITSEICKRFLPAQPRLIQRELALAWDLRGKFDDNAADWNTTKQTGDYLRGKSDEVSWLTATQEGDLELKGPGDDGQKMRYSAWIHMVHTTCHAIWARYQADVPASLKQLEDTRVDVSSGEDSDDDSRSDGSYIQPNIRASQPGYHPAFPPISSRDSSDDDTGVYGYAFHPGVEVSEANYQRAFPLVVRSPTP